MAKFMTIGVPCTSKMGTFFLMPLAPSRMPIYSNFQINGASREIVVIFLKVSPEAPFFVNCCNLA